MKERGNPRKQEAVPRHQAKDESNLTDSQAAGGEPDNRYAESDRADDKY